jgi:hypothetical protein
LPNFEPEESVSSGVVNSVHGGPLRPVDEVDAGGEVAPLVVAAGLQRAAVDPVELEVVQRLQELVAELRVGDALLALQPAATAPCGSSG